MAISIRISTNNVPINWEIKEENDCIVIELVEFSRDFNTNIIVVRLKFCGKEKDKLIKRLKELLE